MTIKKLTFLSFLLLFNSFRTQLVVLKIQVSLLFVGLLLTYEYCKENLNDHLHEYINLIHSSQYNVDPRLEDNYKLIIEIYSFIN